MVDLPATPLPLKSGDTIGVMAPSSFVDRDEIKASVSVLEVRGYKVFVHPQTFERKNQAAGTVLQKSLALQGLLRRDDVDFIWFAGGGNQSLPLLEAINFEAMTVPPKPLCGFSDNTTLLNTMAARCGGVHYHAPVFSHVGGMKDDQLDHVLSVLSGDERALPFESGQVLQVGKAEGCLIGGNLSLFQYLPSLLPNEYIDGAILFLEDCKEELSCIDRIFAFLRQSGVLSHINGLLLGQFTDLGDSGRPFELSLHEIVMEHMQGYADVPIITDLPFGHDRTSRFTPLPVGAQVTLDSDSSAMKW